MDGTSSIPWTTMGFCIVGAELAGGGGSATATK